MESKSKGISWIGNIYQRLEDMCMEVDDMVCQETWKYVENHLQTVGASVKQFCTELMEEVLPSSPTNSLEEFNSSLVQNASVTAYEDLNVSVDEDHSHRELIHSSSVKSLEQSTEDESSSAHSSGFIPSGSVILAQTCKNELQDIDSIADDTSLESMDEGASHKSVSKVEPEAVPVPVPVPSFDNLKLGESCIIVDSSELHSLSDERSSYKKMFREAFYSKSWFAKRDNEQHARSSKEKVNCVRLFSQTNKPESKGRKFCELDWEII